MPTGYLLGGPFKGRWMEMAQADYDAGVTGNWVSAHAHLPATPDSEILSHGAIDYVSMRDAGYGYREGFPPITDISPKTGTIANAGAAGRKIATFTVTGGTKPISLFSDSGAVGVTFSGMDLVTTSNPVAAAPGGHVITVHAVDALGVGASQQVPLTLT